MTDVGKYLLCRVTATNPTGSVPAFSNIVGPVTAVSAANGWDPANSSAGFVLSSGDHTATSSAVGEQGRGIISRSTGLRYFEITFGPIPFGSFIGLTDATHTIATASTAPGITDNAGFTMRDYKQGGMSTGAYYYLLSGASFINGDIVGMACDLGNHLAQFYINGVVAPGSSDLPAPGNALDWGSAAGPVMYPWGGANGAGGSPAGLTLNTVGPFALATLPSGYTAWGA